MGQARYLFLLGLFECAKETPEWKNWRNCTVKSSLVAKMMQRMFQERHDDVVRFCLPQVSGETLPTTAETFAEELKRPFQQYIRTYFDGKQGMLQGEISHGSRDQIAQMVLFMIRDHFPRCKPLLEGIQTIVDNKLHITRFQVKKSPANFLKYIYLHLSNDEEREAIDAEFENIKGYDEFLVKVQNEVHQNIPRPINACSSDLAATAAPAESKPKKVVRRRSSGAASVKSAAGSAPTTTTTTTKTTVRAPPPVPQQKNKPPPTRPEKIVLKVAALELILQTNTWKKKSSTWRQNINLTATPTATPTEKREILEETYQSILTTAAAAQNHHQNNKKDPYTTSKYVADKRGIPLDKKSFVEWYAKPLQMLIVAYFRPTREDCMSVSIVGDASLCTDEQLFHITLLLVRHKWPDCKLLHKGLYQMGAKAEPWNLIKSQSNNNTKKPSSTLWDSNPIRVIEYFRDNYLSKSHKTMFDWEFTSVKNYRYKWKTPVTQEIGYVYSGNDQMLWVIDTVFRSAEFGRARHLIDKVAKKETEAYVAALNCALAPLLNLVKPKLWGNDKAKTLRMLVTILDCGFFGIACGSGGSGGSESLLESGFTAHQRFAILYFLVHEQCPLLKPAILAMGVHRNYITTEGTTRSVRPRLSLDSNTTFPPVLREVLLYTTESERTGFFELIKGNVLLGSQHCGDRLVELWKGGDDLNAYWKPYVTAKKPRMMGTAAASTPNTTSAAVQTTTAANDSDAGAQKHDYELLKGVLGKCKSLPAQKLLKQWLKECDNGEANGAIQSVANATIVTPPPPGRVTPQQQQRTTMKNEKAKSLVPATRPPAVMKPPVITSQQLVNHGGQTVSVVTTNGYGKTIQMSAATAATISRVTTPGGHTYPPTLSKESQHLKRSAASKLAVQKRHAARELEAQLAKKAKMETAPSVQ